MSPRSAFPLLATPSDARTATLQGLLIASVVIAALYVGRDVLLPLALAILLSFVLTPPLLLLRRIKLPRVAAVGIVVGAAFAVIFAIGWLMSVQVTQLAGELPKYQAILNQKIDDFSNAVAGAPLIKEAAKAFEQIEQQLSNPKPDTSVGAEPGPPERVDQGKEPVSVEVRERSPTGLELYQQLAGTLLPPLATAGIVLLFVVFILLQREDLRDRLIRLLGASDLQRATTTLNDAAARLSRYFLRQVVINATYGAFIAVALWLIGIPSPIVWGVLAGLMRFVPYVGSYIAAIPPLLLAAAIAPGWHMVLVVGVLFLASELAMGQAVEPLVFGHGTGISPLAVVVSTVFWTWIWGPLGLLLAMPITVCLAVLGRHVDGLQVFEILLSDEPALTPEESFYQRALSGDAAEATYQAELCLGDQSLVTYLDGVALRGLKLAELDARRGLLEGEHAEKIAATVKEMLDNLGDFEPRRWFFRLRRPNERNGKDEANGLASLAAVENGADDETLPIVERAKLAPGWAAVEEPILCIGGRSVLDEAAAAMLAEVLKKRGLGARALPPETLSAGHIASLSGSGAKLICLSYLGLDTGPAHIRYLVRRLHRILPKGVSIVVCFWADEADAPSVKTLLETAEGDAYASTLSKAVDLCIAAAKGELNRGDERVSEAAPPAVPAPAKPKGREPRRKSQSAVA